MQASLHSGNLFANFFSQAEGRVPGNAVSKQDHSSEPASGAQGDPLQADVGSDNDVVMSSHVKDMLVIYERKPLREEGEEEEEEEEERGGKTYGPFQRKCRSLVRNSRFGVFFGFLVAVDTIAVAMFIDQIVTTGRGDDYLQFILGVLTMAFLVEVLLRAIADPPRAFSSYTVLDACIVLASLVEMLARLIGAQLDIIFLRSFRIFRLLRVKPAQYLPVLNSLAQAIYLSVQPLLIVLVLSGLLIFAFAVMLTSLVPDAVHDGDEVRAAVLEEFGSVARSSLSLLEVLDGTSSCSMEHLFALLNAAKNGKSASIAMIIARLLASFTLYLALSGLVTGVFIEQLFGVTSRVEERAAQQQLVKSHESLMMLDHIFSSAGYTCDDLLTWPEIEKILEANHAMQHRLDINLSDAHRLFEHLDEDKDGAVPMDEYIFSIFKLKTISKSIDMLSIDYQQEKALQRLGELHNNLRLAMAGIQSRLASFSSLLPIMEGKIQEVTFGIDEIQSLEEDLIVANNTRHEILGNECRDVVSAQLSIEMLRSNYHLNERLSALEVEFASLQNQAPDSPALKEKAIGAVADTIVQSIKYLLQEELAAAKAGGGLAPGQEPGQPQN